MIKEKITNIKDEKEDNTTYPKHIKKLIKAYYINQFEKQNEMYKFIEKQNLQKLRWKRNSESVIKDLPTKKIPDLYGFTNDFY